MRRTFPVFVLVVVALLVAACQTPGTKEVINSLNKDAFVKEKPAEKIIRKSAIAGSWYPEDADIIRNVLDSYMKKGAVIHPVGRIVAMIVPHAGWRYSGQTAAKAYSLLKKQRGNIKTVVVIGPSHTYPFYGASIPDVTHYETPLGLIPISQKAKTLLKQPHFKTVVQAHKREHSIEIELPFLQHVFGKFELVPILIGEATDEDLKEMAQSLGKIIDDKTLIVISSDFTHYGPNYRYLPFTENIPENLKKLDFAAIDAILNISPEKFSRHLRETRDTICGRKPILLLLHYLKGKDVRPELVAYQTSGNITGDYTNSVSYASIIFTEQTGQFTPEEKKQLLTLARKTLETYLKEGKKPRVNADALPEKLTRVQGCFVTLNENGMLRGCIGHILPQEELYKCVMDNAINAAVNDRRFRPVTYDELKNIDIEISALTVPEQIPFANGEDLKNKIVPLKDGIVLKRGWRQSTYLPQVWEQLPDKEEFLTRLCLKGGMPPDCWKTNDTQAYKYNAVVFGE